MNLRKENWKGFYNAMPPFVQRWADVILYRQSIPDALSRFLTAEEKADTKLIHQIKKDLMECRKKYKSEVNEYFLFGFRDLTDKERSKFLTRRVKDKTMQGIVGFDVFTREVRNKYNFYLIMQPYFGRDVMLIPKGGGNLDSFKSFANKHPNLFIKSNSLSKGRGAGLYHIGSESEAEKVYDKLKKTGGDWIVEEKVNQSAEMAQWNESSVNTVRLPAVLNNGQWTVIGPAFRTGRKGAVVDNASAGGLFACIDPTTGILCTDGFDDKHGLYYDKHPDCGIVFKGWQVPHWNELLKLAEKIHRTVPHHKYIGWDFALTDKGWVLIEGNWGQFLSQYNDKIGLKKQFFELLGIKE